MILDPMLSGRIPLRRLAFTAIALDAAMIVIRVSSYRELVGMPGSVPFIVKPLVVLALYLAAATWITSQVGGNRAVALSVGTSFGLLTAAVQIIHLCIESFVTTEGRVTGLTAIFFMLGTFLLWGVAGYFTGRRGAPVSSAAIAASWAAIVCMLILVGFGLALTFASIPSAPYVSTWAEFRSSGWTDARAFGIANTLDSACSHLLFGPIVGTIAGAIGGFVGKQLSSRTSSTPIYG